MDKNRIGINMLITAAFVRVVVMVIPSWFLIVPIGWVLSIASLGIAVWGLYYLYEASGKQRITKGLICAISAVFLYRIVAAIIYSILGGIVTLIIAAVVLSYLRVYQYQAMSDLFTQE